MRTFKSKLGYFITDFINEKKGNGFSYEFEEYMLKRFDLSVTADIDIGARGHVKDGVLRTASGTSRVLGLPSLSRFSRTSLYQAVGSLRPF